MKKTWTTLFGLTVALATGTALAQDIQGNAQAGAGKVAMCIGCHSIPGYQASFPEVHKVPMISGQGAGYISAALHAYQKGERRHPTMRGIADTLTDQDIADVAAFYAGQGPAEAGAAQAREPGPQVAALLQKGACVSCHGDNFSKPIDGSYPKLAGQYSDYLFVALKAYKRDPAAYVGRSNGVMASIAKQFSNAELKELAHYMGSLDGDLRVVPQSRFR